ncbi:hypothetical protein KBY82_03080 [Cyanobium sp. AMD-g]|uniref:hypothetical protein n=1 Tax=Cyanobium sp. AMD-g TaxID=2823699 RepID=UPI0020CDAFBF|nr:hypothetical protein [Cyanobium sp. AMD-g]MCP9929762.1 hypothetical protein [Cyanobium sp. AMD-g]
MTPTRRKQLRQLLWLYFWLLIFEGALRKWFLPSLSTPLLLVRDPVALLAVWWGWPLLRQRRWQIWLLPLLLIGPLSFALAVAVGHGDLFTALYGSRVMLLQLPLIFVFAAVFDRRDVIRFAWVMLWLSIPMTVLLATQSGLPDSHFLNVGPGGFGTAAFEGALGRSRPPGTFTFINGVSSFYGLAAASLFIVLYGTRVRQRGRLLSMAAGIALVVALPVSISRSLLAGYLLVLIGLIAALSFSRARLLPVLSGVAALVIAFGLATTIPAFQDTSAAFQARWEGAGGVDRQEVGDAGIVAYQIQNRVLPGFTGPLNSLDRIPILGYGIGMGSNVGAQRLGGGQGFLLGEGGWEVSIGELGVLLGIPFIFWRVALAIWMVRLAIRAATQGNLLPLILAGGSFLDVLSGQLSQPTGLGFMVLSAGLTLAACNTGSATSKLRILRAQPTDASLVPTA